jgi:hypothetical protein
LRRSNPEPLRGELLDCFAALAMTEYDARAWLFPLHLACRHRFSSSRLVSPELCFVTPPSNPRGRREGRVPTTHPRSAARNAHAGRTAQQHTGGADHSAFPARWSDGLCRALPGAELSFGLPRPRGLHRYPRRLTQMPPPQELDRSNDGQDHTVLPYARPAISPAVFPALSTKPKTCRRDEPSSAVRPRAATGSPGTTLPARTSRARRCRVHRRPGSRK